MSLTPRERERLDALVASYRRLPRPEPSAELDAAVLARARGALRGGGRPRWPALLATAATLTVAVGLTWQLRDSDQRVEPEVPRAVVIPVPQKGLEETATTSPVEGHADGETGAFADAPVDAPAPAGNAAPAPAAAAGTRSAAEAPALAKQPPGAGSEAKQATDDQGAAARSESAADSVERVEKAEVLAEPFPETEAVPAPPAQIEERKPAPAATTPARRVEAPKPVSQPYEAPPASPPAPAEPVFDAPAPLVAPPPPPPPPPPATAPSAASGGSAGPARDAAPRKRAAEPESNASREQAQESLSLGSGLERTPQAWIEEIEALLRAGQRERAIEELERFREAHPDHELPEALRRLLP